MYTSSYFRSAILPIFIFISGYASAQVDTGKIKTSWTIDKFEVERSTAQIAKVQQELQGVYLTFGSKELVISKKTGSGDSLVKKGSYFLSGNTLTLGKDQAEILELSEKNLTLKIPGGILYLSKM